MRKVHLSFQCFLAFVILFSFLTHSVNAQVPILGPVTFGTDTTLPTGWTVQHGSKDKNYWEMINTIYPSQGYSNPEASGGSHIKIDASSTYYDYLTSPVIDCSNFTGGVLKFGAWRSVSYDKDLYIYLDLNGDNVFSECRYIIPHDSIPKVEQWVLCTVNLKDTINHRPKVSIRFGQSPYGIKQIPYGPLRIDDITLYAFTSTLPTDHFRTRASGTWENKAVWESSRDSINWMPAGLVPDHQSSSVSICNTHNVIINSPLIVDQLTVKNNGSLILAHDLALKDGPGEDLLVENGSVLDLSNYHITTGGTIQLNGLLKTANPEGLCGSTTTGIASGVSLNTPGPDAVIEYNAEGSQMISPLPLYTNLTISGSGEKILTGTTTVTKNLQLNKGWLLLDAYNLIVGNTATCTLPGYVKINSTGRLTIRDIGTGLKTFPIGNSSYNPVTISNGSGLDWTVGIKDAWAPSEAVLGTSSDKAIHRTWSITPSLNPPTAAADILFEYNDTDPSQTGTGINKTAPVIVWRKAEDSWLIVGEPRYPISTPNGKTVTISCNNLFTLFAISNVDMPLPVRFRDVSAHQRGSTVILSFTNETESGVEAYNLERSIDGQNYTYLHSIRPLKNDGTSVSYETRDELPVEALNFYRIKGIEIGGKATYSPVVHVNLKESDACMTIIPNPAHKGDIWVQLTNVPQDGYNVALYNAEGKVVQYRFLQHPGGSASFPLRIEQLRPGTYLLELSGKEKLLQRLIIL
jgi:hypothetical protein